MKPIETRCYECHSTTAPLALVKDPRTNPEYPGTYLVLMCSACVEATGAKADDAFRL